MASLGGILGTASKRSRSQQSLTPLGSISPNSASRTASRAATPEAPSAKIPAFLRQNRAEILNRFRELNWQEKIRISQGRHDSESPWAQDSNSATIQRNRYIGVQPWNRSRILLKVPEGSSDYINASPILLEDPRTGVETSYIATQGPKKNGVGHFWQMVRHETTDVAVIVMLTPTEDAGREKCYQYFPLNASSEPITVRANGFEGDQVEGRVSFVEQEPNLGRSTTIRKLKLAFGDDTKEVWHLLFTAFPDFGVPEDEDRAELLQLLNLAHEKNSSPTNPKIVHCSAGVGRTGTFIALEYLMSQLKSGAVAEAHEDEDMIQEVVHRLREQRMMMVQMDVQYEFLYKVLREEFEKQLHRDAGAGQPSPKMRRVGSGLKQPMDLGDNDPSQDSAQAVQQSSQETITSRTLNSTADTTQENKPR